MSRKERLKATLMDGLTTLILMACVYGFMNVAIDKWEENDNAQRIQAHEYLAEFK